MTLTRGAEVLRSVSFVVDIFTEASASIASMVVTALPSGCAKHQKLVRDNMVKGLDYDHLRKAGDVCEACIGGKHKKISVCSKAT